MYLTCGSRREPVPAGMCFIKWGPGHDEEGISKKAPTIIHGGMVATFTVEIPERGTTKTITTSRPVLSIRQIPSEEKGYVRPVCTGLFTL